MFRFSDGCNSSVLGMELLSSLSRAFTSEPEQEVYLDPVKSNLAWHLTHNRVSSGMHGGQCSTAARGEGTPTSEYQ